MRYAFLFKVFIKLSFAVILLELALPASGQHSANDINDATWIKMIDDPSVNYYEAIRVYNEFWKTHKKPEDPEDRLHNADKDKLDAQEESEVKPEEKKFELTMIYQTKRFENWMREEKPFVQEDGSILSSQQRMAIWKKQQEEKAK